MGRYARGSIVGAKNSFSLMLSSSLSYEPEAEEVLSLGARSREDFLARALALPLAFAECDAPFCVEFTTVSSAARTTLSIW